jgi:uncharacterized protein YkwD
MASRNYLEHRTPDGGTPRDRVLAAQYRARDLAENLAAGVPDLPDALQTWLDSPHHCENLMDPGFADVAVACVAQPGTQWGTYWTMLLGRR